MLIFALILGLWFYARDGTVTRSIVWAKQGVFEMRQIVLNGADFLQRCYQYAHLVLIQIQ